MGRNVSASTAPGIVDRLARGERVVVAVSERGYGVAGLVLDVGRLGVPRRLTSIDRGDPIVFLTDLPRSVDTASGRPYRLHVDDLVVLPSMSELAVAAPADVVVKPIAWCDEGPIAAELEFDRGGILVLVGSSTLLDRRAGARADNAELALLVRTGSAAASIDPAEALEGPRPASERLVPVIDLSTIDPAEFASWRQATPTDGSDLVSPADVVVAPSFLRAAGHAARLLPPAFHDALVDMADDRPAAGALLVRSVPIGELPPTPSRPTAPTGKDMWTEFLLLTVARRLGQPVGYEPEHGGGLVQNLVPVNDAEGRQLSTSSDVLLEFHTETAFHRHRPRYLLLLCLRGDPEASTLVASVTWALDQMSVEHREILAEPRFRLGVDESFAGERTDRLGRRRAVLSGDPFEPDLTFDADLMVGTDPAASAALDALRRALADVTLSIVLEPGDLLVIDNHRVVHGRSPFRARYDGTDRWLQRAFVVADLLPSAAERHGRVITTRYRP